MAKTGVHKRIFSEKAKTENLQKICGKTGYSACSIPNL